MTNTIRTLIAALALLAVGNVSFAQQRTRTVDKGAEAEWPVESFAGYLFPPELIMHFQHKINLRPDQRTTITQAIQQMQSKVVDLQWQMQSEVQKLTELMMGATIKETEALAQVDRVLGIEREVKRTHLGTLIRIKNTLTREQQTALDSLQQMWAKKAPRAENRDGTARVVPPDSVIGRSL